MDEGGRRRGRRLRLPWRQVVATVMVLVLAKISSNPVQAHGSPDQVNDPPPLLFFACPHESQSSSMGQWFTPARPNLVATEMVLSTWGVPPGGITLHLDIRDGGPDGAILASATATVAGPQGPPGTVVRPHFDLASPLRGISGRSLFLELGLPPDPSPGTAMFGWEGRNDNPYPGGRVLQCFRGLPGTAPPPPDLDADFNFITFWEGDGANHVCPQIRKRVPEAAIRWALSNPDRVRGYNELERRDLAPGPYNRLRTWLSLHTLSVPYHPLGNGLVYRAGCP